MLIRFLRFITDLEPNRHFLKLWGSQLLSLTAFNMVNFTLLIRVYELSASTTLVSLFVLSFGIPSLIFGAVAGVFADRWNRRRVLIVSNVLRTVIVLAFLPVLSQLPAIYAITFVMATVTQFFTPAEGALIPELVERKRLVAANGIFVVTMFLSFVLGYGLAGPLAATGGDQLPILLASVLFGLAALCCLALPASRHRPQRVRLAAAYREVRIHLKEGMAFAASHRPVRYGLAQLTFIWATVGVVMVVLPAYTAQVLELNLREVSRLMILPIGVGMLAGGYLLPRLRQHYRTKTIITISLLLAGAMMAALGQVVGLAAGLAEWRLLTSDPGVAKQIVTSAASTVLGLAIAMVMIAAQTLIHERTTAALRGRIFGVLGMSVNAANTVPVLLAGALTDVLSVTTMITLVGVLLIIWGFVSPQLAGRTRAVSG